MTDISKLRWHRYGSVEVALNPEDSRPDDDYVGNGPPEPDMVVYARYIRPTSRPGASRIEYDERVFRQSDDGDYWFDVAKPTEQLFVTNDPFFEPDAPTYLFQAAATLLWDEYEQFQAADRAMGDPNP